MGFCSAGKAVTERLHKDWTRVENKMGNSYFRIPAMWEQGARRLLGEKVISAFDSPGTSLAGFLQEETFHSMLTMERRRAERSRKPFVLMVIEPAACIEADENDRFMSRVTSVLVKSTRETDLVGWYKKGTGLGLIFTEINLEFATHITEILQTKVVSALENGLGIKVNSKLVVTVHLFPENRVSNGDEPSADMRLYPDIAENNANKGLSSGR